MKMNEDKIMINYNYNEKRVILMDFSLKNKTTK